MRKAGTENLFLENMMAIIMWVFTIVPAVAVLFFSSTKYDPGTGWPSYTSPVDEANIDYHEDFSFVMKRIEVRCAKRR